jgi:hypothetical protein
MTKNNSSYTSPFLSKNSKDKIPDIPHMPEMSHITYANIIGNIKVYSEYLMTIFKTQYLKNTDNKTSYYRKIEKKLNLTTSNTPKRYNKHLNLLLAVLYCASKINFKKDIKDIKVFIDYLMSIVSLLESSDITGLYHYHSHKTSNTYTEINNRYYFMLAKDYLKIINKKIRVINKDFYDQTLLENKETQQYFVIFLSNTHIKTLLSLIQNNNILSSHVSSPKIPKNPKSPIKSLVPSKFSLPIKPSKPLRYISPLRLLEPIDLKKRKL